MQFEPHFAAEEAVLLPVLRSAGATAEAEEALRQQAALGALARRMGTNADALPAWGEAMQAHVRWEERHLLPLAERLLRLYESAAPALATT